MLGVPAGKVILIPWTEAWEQEFEAEKRAIASVIGGLVRGIHHIGSTAVKHLHAKPIIDIAIEVGDPCDASACIRGLEQTGYVCKGDMVLPERYYLTKGKPRTHQIHLFHEGGRYLEQHLAFRDHLRSDEEDRHAYQLLKYRLAAAHHDDRIAYAEAKSDFVQEVLAKIRRNEAKPE
ncbi:hypothetical protein PAESOLCIP111_06505 [Paenibacillus solanacearum]|uniref:GrpB family protein n=1 Tax=Paenibacillus solanacearum TaxID=2048548 RepID=A0A916K8E8_9BACL|nr:GrpB family protein [Paenibacillus solanacearum]CAG7652333.1 hypothetical protein PAESOLCIP111_06505 [Paenibacillus solanacearum]